MLVFHTLIIFLLCLSFSPSLCLSLFALQEELRELSEQQEELTMETEHELREEVDMSQNQIRQLGRRLEASQDSIIDQQQTIEKFREVVRHLQVCQTPWAWIDEG